MQISNLQITSPAHLVCYLSLPPFLLFSSCLILSEEGRKESNRRSRIPFFKPEGPLKPIDIQLKSYLPIIYFPISHDSRLLDSALYSLKGSIAWPFDPRQRHREPMNVSVMPNQRNPGHCTRWVFMLPLKLSHSFSLLSLKRMVFTLLTFFYHLQVRKCTKIINYWNSPLNCTHHYARLMNHLL